MRVTTNHQEFRRWVTRRMKGIGESALAVRQAGYAQLFTELVAESPVSTPETRPEGGHGQFRYAWNPSNGSAQEYVPAFQPSFPKPGEERVLPVVRAMKHGVDSFITNAMPYARRLFHGWSQQAPAGWAHRAVRRASRRVADEIARRGARR